ncbi:MAG: hypothetical protein LAP39_13435 [Acidobacteriia bacterium]|nr:hypothetical protein [Terriglobia bacterium]
MVVLVASGAREPRQITGALIDANDDGFRVRHPYEGFQPGDLVSFIHRMREGTARVVWHKALGSDFETGFSYC